MLEELIKARSVQTNKDLRNQYNFYLDKNINLPRKKLTKSSEYLVNQVTYFPVFTTRFS